VRTLVLVVGLVANAAVTPVGRPPALSVTAPVKPLVGVTVMVLEPEDPEAIVRLAGAAESEKSEVPAPGIVRARVAL